MAIVKTLGLLVMHKNPWWFSGAVDMAMPSFVFLLRDKDKNIGMHAMQAILFCIENSMVDKKLMKKLMFNVDTVLHLRKLMEGNGVAVLLLLRMLTQDNVSTESCFYNTSCDVLRHVISKTEANTEYEENLIATSITTTIASMHLKNSQVLIDTGFMDLVIYSLKGHAKEDACSIVRDITSCGKLEPIVFLVNVRAIPLLCDLLFIKDSRLLTIVLHALNNILSVAREHVTHFSCKEIIEKCGGFSKIRLLQIHGNSEVCKLSYAIIENFVCSRAGVPERPEPPERPEYTCSNVQKIEYNKALEYYFHTSAYGAWMTAMIKDILPDIVLGMRSSDAKIQLETTKLLHHMLSVTTPPMDDVISSGVLPILIKLLTHTENELQIASCWILAIFAKYSSTLAQKVVEAEEAIPTFIKLLEHSEKKIYMSSVMTLALIAGHGPDLRDLLISGGVIQPMISLLRKEELPTDHRQRISSALCTFCLYKYPHNPPEAVKVIMSAFAHLIHDSDKRTVTSSLRGINFLTNQDFVVEDVVNADVVPRLCSLIAADEDGEQFQLAFETVLRIFTRSYSRDLLKRLHAIYKTACDSVRLVISKIKPHWKDCMTASHIASMDVKNDEFLIGSGLIDPILYSLNEGDSQNQEDAYSIVHMIASHLNPYSTMALVHSGAIPSLCNLLSSPDFEVLINVLCTLHKIVTTATEDIKEIVEECGGLGKIRELESHENLAVGKMSHMLIGSILSRPPSQMRWRDNKNDTFDTESEED